MTDERLYLFTFVAPGPILQLDGNAVAGWDAATGQAGGIAAGLYELRAAYARIIEFGGHNRIMMRIQACVLGAPNDGTILRMREPLTGLEGYVIGVARDAVISTAPVLTGLY